MQLLPPSQGLPEGHTEAAWPLRGSGVQAHRVRPLRDSDAAAREGARFALIGNAVTVQVREWSVMHRGGGGGQEAHKERGRREEVVVKVQACYLEF